MPRSEEDTGSSDRRKKRARHDGNDDTRMHKRPRQDKSLWDAEPTIHPEDAFRESLFDALADAEGAEYWARIYGQPIHIYPRHKFNAETGEYERRSDDEYVRFVQAEMYRKTQAGFREEREQRRRKAEQESQRTHEDVKRAREEKARLREKQHQAANEERLQREIDRSLRRAEERKRKLAKQHQFAEYTKLWEEWNGEQATIPWPTETGRRAEISEKSIRSFFVRGMDLKALGGKAFSAKLKDQRVRWHPDKMQQKMGGKDKVEKGVMADITMTFQVIDDLWNDTRKAK